jgi:hypothetical protein
MGKPLSPFIVTLIITSLERRTDREDSVGGKEPT